MMIDKLKETNNTQLFGDDPLEFGKYSELSQSKTIRDLLIYCKFEIMILLFCSHSFLDQLVQNIACEVNKLVKRFIEDNHRMGLADWAISGINKSLI